MQTRSRAIGRVFRLGAINVGLALLSVCVASISVGACGGPRYPSCDNDEQCNTAGHKGVCMQHLCTECRDNAQCGKGQECQAGACTAIADYCEDDKGCEGGSCSS